MTVTLPPATTRRDAGDRGDTSPAGRSGGRPVGSRRPLPGSRAVVGGLLVGAAALATFVAVTGAGRPPSTTYLVATRALRPGDTVRPSDVRLVAMDLPPAQARVAFTDAASLHGRAVRAPVAAHELLGPGDIGDRAVPLVSLAIEAADALGGALLPGDVVDVYVSFGSGTGAVTRVVEAGARVAEVAGSDGAIGDAGSVLVTLEVGDPARRLQLVSAAHAGTVTLARVTGADDRARRDERFVEPGEAAGGPTRTATTAPARRGRSNGG